MEELSDEQSKAVSDHSKYIRILASAGSGKTKTLVASILKKINDGKSPESLIAFTFTRKAAQELSNRVYVELRGKIDDNLLSKMYIGTIHSFCLNYLTAQSEYIGWDLMDELPIQSIVYRLYDELQLDKVYGVKYPHGVAKFLKDYELYENELLSIDDLPDNIRSAIETFQSLLIESRIFTYGSIIRHCVNRIEKVGGLKFLNHLFVDEYQDVNPAQERLIKAMINEKAGLSVVGDDLQCIYQWRGSNVENIINFNQNYPGSQSYILSKNYRSRKDIVEYAEKFMDTISERTEKTMTNDRKNTPPAQGVFHLSSADESQQANDIARCIQQAISSGYHYHDIAILLRSVTNSGEPIIRELDTRGIPTFSPQYFITGNSITRSLFIPLFDILRSNSEPKNCEEEQKLENNIQSVLHAHSKYTTDKNNRKIMMEFLAEWREAVHASKYNVLNIREKIFQFLNVSAIRLDESNVNLMWEIGLITQVCRGVEEAYRRNISQGKRNTLQMYTHLYHTLTQQDEIKIKDPLDLPEIDAVFLSTVHQSKGLEWPIVIVPCLNKKLFPVRERNHASSFSDDIACRYGTHDIDERRLFYVACTRARDSLILMNLSSEKESPYYHFGIEQGYHNFEDVTLLQFKPESRPLKDMQKSIGLSDLLILIECPFQYVIRRKYGMYPPVGDELGYGRSIHGLIQQISERDGDLNDKEVETLMNQVVHLPYESPERQRVHKASILNQIQSLNKLVDLGEIQSSEIEVRFFIEGYLISGIIDGVQPLKNGKAKIIDWKTSIHSEFLKRYIMQLQLYAYAVEQTGMPVDDAQIIDVSASCKSGKLVIENVDVSPKLLKSVISLTSKRLSKMNELTYDATPSDESCRACDMGRLCARMWKNAK